MSSVQARVQEQLKQCGKLLAFMMGLKDAAPFLEPVDWKAWGLLDYPKVVKTPMDLGTVKDKLENNEYAHPREYKHDVNLVWANCMTYNADGSEYYNVANNLRKIHDEKYAKIVKEDEEPQDLARPPTLVDKKMFAQNIYNLSSEDLGRVVQMIDQRSEAAIKKIDAEDLEIDVDAIDANTFWAVDALVKDCLPGGKKATKKGAAGRSDAPPSPKAARGTAGGSAASDGTKLAKKPRVG